MCRMPRLSLDTGEVLASVGPLVEEARELAESSWKGVANPASSGPAAARLGATAFPIGICDYASQRKPGGRVRAWTVCTPGERHKVVEHDKGDGLAWDTGERPVCQLEDGLRPGWLEEQP